MALQALLHDLLEHGLAEEEAFVERLSDEERNETGSADSWSAHDNLAHNAAWKEQMAANLDALARSEEPWRTNDIDATNADFYWRNHDLTWAQVMEYDRNATHALLDRLSKTSEDGLRKPYPVTEVAPTVWRAFIGDGFIHPILHLAIYLSQHGQAEAAVKLEQTAGEKALVLDSSPEWRGMQIYNLACIQAHCGQKKEALANLRLALTLYPDLTPGVQHDPDLNSLHGDVEFEQIAHSA